MTLSTAQAGAALALPERLIPLTARNCGVANWPAYLDYNDAKATRHLPHNGLITKRFRRRPLPAFDDQGSLIRRVPLDERGDKYAIVDAADWIALQEADCDGRWSCDNNGAGRLRVKSARPMAKDKALNHVIVARYILDLGDDARMRYRNGAPLDHNAGCLQVAGARMRYRNGDPLDLRRCNLDRTGQTTSPDTRPARYNPRTAVRVGAGRRKQLTAGGAASC